jgi:hypothetical protein
MRRLHRVVLLSTLVLGAPVRAQSPVPARTWTAPDAPAEMRYVLSRADLIVATMQDSLLRELNDALRQGGPDFAVKSCHIDVAGIIHRIGRQEGVAAGRTSDRLRSPANAPRPWAAALVAAHAGRRAHDVPGFVVDLGDKVGVLRPIAHRPMCAGCHGPAELLTPAVRAELLDRYPRDRAVGFAEGEIRGWFWVEMPKIPR